MTLALTWYVARNETVDTDVIRELPLKEELPAYRYHELVPDWPQWARGQSTYGGGRLAAPYFVSRYLGQDYALHQGVDWPKSSELPVPTQRVVLYELDREPSEAEWPWTWRKRLDDIPELGIEDDIGTRLNVARRRLPEILQELRG